MSVKARITAVILAVLLGAVRVAADPLPLCTDSNPCHLRMREPTTLQKDDGTQYRLPPGHFYDEGTNQTLDLEFKRLQDQETRLTAENKSLKESFANTWTPGWFTVTLAILVGAGLGAGSYYWYEHR